MFDRLGLQFAELAALRGVEADAGPVGAVVETPLTADFRNGPRYEELVADIPMKRWGELEEVSRVVRFVASDAASYMTGAVIAVDGGWSA